METLRLLLLGANRGATTRVPAHRSSRTPAASTAKRRARIAVLEAQLGQVRQRLRLAGRVPDRQPEGVPPVANRGIGVARYTRDDRQPLMREELQLTRLGADGQVETVLEESARTRVVAAHPRDHASVTALVRSIALARVAAVLACTGRRDLLAAHLRGEITLDEALVLMKRQTRVFVRRQGNWFKRDDPRIQWVEAGPGPVDARVINALESAVRRWLSSTRPTR
mgnify:CR=1 FL=1